MQLFRHWIEATTTITIDGVPTEITCYGHSNDSLDDARENAREQAASIEKKISDGRGAVGEYDVAVREEIIEVIDSRNIVSRNRYGALVLNSESVVFIDIDEPRLGLWEWLFGRRGRTKKQKIRDMIEKRIAQGDYTQLAFRLYETRAGMRLVVDGQDIPPQSDESRNLLRAFNCDPLYAMLCVRQQSYRARLTPKPYRMRLKGTRIHYPRNADDEQSTQTWVADYDNASARFATCKFVKAFGRQSRSDIIQYHDNMTRAHEAMKLA